MEVPVQTVSSVPSRAPGTYIRDSVIPDHEKLVAIENLLLANWIGKSRALKCSLNEFRTWRLEEVKTLFATLPPTEGKGRERRLLSPHGPHVLPATTGLQWWRDLVYKCSIMGAANLPVIGLSPFLMLTPQGRRGLFDIYQLNIDYVLSSFFIKPTMEVLLEGIRLKRAVCVNGWGQFRVMDSGYAAISHVWCETMAYEYHGQKVAHDERGLNVAHFSRIIKEAAKSGSSWFWLDLLAIPQPIQDSKETDKLREIKADIINSLVEVYTRADTVVILDSLTLQMSSTDACEVAAVLSCGLWMTRMWTFQEIKLARRACIITKLAAIDFMIVMDALNAKVQRPDSEERVWNAIYWKLYRLQPIHRKEITLSEVALACCDRSTESDIDYARSLFAVLRLDWNASWKYEDAIQKIIQTRPQEMARIANMNGARGLPAPYTWAPKYLAQLEGRALDGFAATAMGLCGRWYMLKVCKVLEHNIAKRGDKILFNVELTDGVSLPVWAQMQAPRVWYPAMDEWLKKSVPGGKAIILSARQPRIDDIWEAPTVLLVTHEDYVAEIGTYYGSVAGSAALSYIEDREAPLQSSCCTWMLG